MTHSVTGSGSGSEPRAGADEIPADRIYRAVTAGLHDGQPAVEQGEDIVHGQSVVAIQHATQVGGCIFAAVVGVAHRVVVARGRIDVHVGELQGAGIHVVALVIVVDLAA